MAALSVSALCLPKCSVAQINNNIRSMPIKVGQVKNPALQLQRRSFKIHAVAKKEELAEEFQIGVSLSNSIDKELLNKYSKEEYAEKASAEYTSAIEVLSFGGYLDEAFELKKCMETKGIPVTPDTYCVLIMGLCLGKRLDEAKELFKEAKERPGCEPNEFSYGALIERMYLDELYEGAVILLEDMVRNGVEPLEATVVGFINALCEGKFYTLATEIVNETLQPNVVYYNCLIEALGRIDEVGLAKNVLTLMQQRGVDPDYECYSSVVANCVGKELYYDAAQVVAEMVAKGFDVAPLPGKPAPKKIQREDEDQGV